MAPRTPRSRTAAQSSPPRALVRAGPLTTLPEILSELGCDPEPIFAGTGLTPSQLEDPDVELPYVPLSRLLERCVTATGCDHLGLLMGKRAGPSCLGIAGFMLRNAPDVGTALRDLLGHLELHDQGGAPTLAISGDIALLGYVIHLPGVKAADQIYDLSIAVGCNIMRSLCGAAWSPTEVLLSRPRPGNPTPYKRFFRAPVRFGAGESAVVFPGHWLDHRTPGADPLLYRHLKKEATALLSRRDPGLAGELRRLLRQSLSRDGCSLTQAAGQLGMHPRTLNRRLQDQGTSFRRELDKVRRELACQLLAESPASLSEVSMALGYSDPSAFSRAFRRWSGTTPAQWRGQAVTPEGRVLGRS